MALQNMTMKKVRCIYFKTINYTVPSKSSHYIQFLSFKVSSLFQEIEVHANEVKELEEKNKQLENKIQ